MINKFKTWISKGKKTDHNSSFSYPINEKYLEPNLNEASFLTHHSPANRSFNSSDAQTMNTENENLENNEFWNQNFTAILNAPQPKTVTDNFF